MPPTASYTDATLDDYLVLALGDYASILGWVAASSQVQQAVADTYRLLGLTTEAALQATNAAEVEAVGAVAVLRRAVTSLGARYNVAEDAQSFHRSDLIKHAKEALAIAEAHAMPYLAEYAVQISAVTYAHDAYAPYDEDVQVLP